MNAEIACLTAAKVYKLVKHHFPCFVGEKRFAAGVGALWHLTNRFKLPLASVLGL